jgi:alkylhydroperoxidase family enzyme
VPPVHDDVAQRVDVARLLGALTAEEREALLLRYLSSLVAQQRKPPAHLHEEAREAGWTDEQLLEAIAFAALETFTAMVNVAGDVPADGSVEQGRQLRAA